MPPFQPPSSSYPPPNHITLYKVVNQNNNSLLVIRYSYKCWHRNSCWINVYSLLLLLIDILGTFFFPPTITNSPPFSFFPRVYLCVVLLTQSINVYFTCSVNVAMRVVMIKIIIINLYLCLILVLKLYSHSLAYCLGHRKTQFNPLTLCSIYFGITFMNTSSDEIPGIYHN